MIVLHSSGVIGSRNNGMAGLGLTKAYGLCTEGGRLQARSDATLTKKLLKISAISDGLVRVILFHVSLSITLL